MTTRALPLNSLRVFEAVARHCSLKKAADELCVTPSAVSRQLAHLEELVGVQLVRRFNQGIELTPLARQCLPRLQEGLEYLREAVDLLHTRVDTHALTVVAPPSFAMRWLMPRLHRFAMMHPEIDVQVSTRLDPFGERRGARKPVADFQGWVAEADVVLMFAGDTLADTTPDLRIEPLVPLSITPLCSPRLLDAAPHGISEPEDILRHVLLHDDRGLRYKKKSFWRHWLDAAGLRDRSADDGLHFTHSLMALEAAVEGLGIVASTPVLVEEELRSGRLVAPFGLQVPLRSAYHVISNDVAYRRDDVVQFRAWLHSEVARAAAQADAPAAMACAPA